MKATIHLSLLFVLALSVSGQPLPHAPLSCPTYEPSDREQAARMNDASRTNLAPVYPYLAEFLVDKFQLSNKQGIGIDIGAGPGNLVLELCQRTPRFYWVHTDINTYQAEPFFRKAITNQCAHRVGVVFADVHRLPFRNDYADVIVSRGSLQFWENQKTAFGEIYRTLKSGGHAYIGRGFPPNLPLETAKTVRTNQGKGMPKYDVQETAEQLRALMQELNITNYEIIRPRTDQSIVNYGVWVHFTKSPR